MQVLRFSVSKGTVVLDSVKVVREGLDVFSDFWLACGPLALYITWGFLDAFIQNYVRSTLYLRPRCAALSCAPAHIMSDFRWQLAWPTFASRFNGSC